MTKEEWTDVAIIGAGPVGLFSVFKCGMLGLKCHVLDTLSVVGGQCAALYPEKPIYDIPAYPSIFAYDLIEKLSAQCAPFQPKFHLGHQVTHLEGEGTDWTLKTSQGLTLRAKAIIIAAGAGAFGPNRPPLDGIETYEEKSIFYYITNRQIFEGKHVVIAGGGDSAVDWALSLQEIAASVSVVHRRPKFRAAPESERQLMERVKAQKITLEVPFQLKALEGHDGQLSQVVLEDFDGNLKKIPADFLLPFYGLSTHLGPILEWGLHISHNHISVRQDTCATTVPGIYAVGDVATYPKKLKLILTGFAEAAQAAYAAREHIHPDVALHFEHSTTSGVKTLS